ncbi:fibronectin type III-like domain-contianing protein [Arthrobacter sp. 18067]|uniref:fibronectin type III-like domain-contianing protein n=1 Tax=Arthrobacter sp. 18067 TaxID=2681413 RepID=UPI0034DDA64D
MEDFRAGKSAQVAVFVANTGAREGDEVTMMFIRDLVASLAQPVRRLRAFTRSSLQTGDTKPFLLNSAGRIPASGTTTAAMWWRAGAFEAVGSTERWWASWSSVMRLLSR